MEAKLTNSNIVVTNTELHRAWHLLTILLRIGRPCPPSDLASHCVLFPAPSDYVKHLCSIPNSPIKLTNSLFVIPSVVALLCFRRFVSNLSSIEGFRTYGKRRKRIGLEVEVVPVMKKRAVLYSGDEYLENIMVSVLNNGSPSDCTKVDFPRGGYMARRIDTQASDISIMKLESEYLSRLDGKNPFLLNLNDGLLSFGLKSIDLQSSMRTSIFEHMKKRQYVRTPESQHSFLNFVKFTHIPHPITVQKVKACMHNPERSILTTPTENLVVWKDTKIGEIGFRTSCYATSCIEVQEQTINPPVEAENVGQSCQEKNVGTTREEKKVIGKEEEPLNDFILHEGGIEEVVPKVNTSQPVMSNDAKVMHVVMSTDMISSSYKEKTTANMESKDVLLMAELSVNQKQLMKSSSKLKTSQKDSLNLKHQALCKALGNGKTVISPIEQLKSTRDKSTRLVKQKLKQNCDQNKYTKKWGEKHRGKGDKPMDMALNNQQEARPLPNFESFTIVEEEGSGGYGTVYRAQRKNDGVTFAIKCPHANANRYHVHNELKMLERFGGKNFVIKYEGSFKSGNSECLVLEHVEHDRPEVLKREVDVFQLQWYGYCMFRALAGLHKQGIVHRDVKPGNFLFSCKVNKGYLIDFNLAMDLHQKYGVIDKTKAGYDTSFKHVPLVHAKTLPPTNQKFVIGKSLDTFDRGAGKVSKPLLLPKNLKRKGVDQTNAFSDLGSRNVMKSQGVDGSGITSAKDATSTRTPSTERLREPVPCQGRKELINLVHKAMQSPNYEAQSIPASKRKRVAALPGKVDRKLVYLTPMPLSSTGIAVAGAGLVKNKGDGKQKKEGPCVGTKGFRAPEVLFRSPHQGPKIDVWSAGVTLLYLIIGRTPFTGEPDQNIKEIAKLRGNEDLWEVAKLHKCESSFPVDLYDVQFLPSMKLRDWCKQNTKRPEFIDVIPRSLFDLVDKCLIVNQRLRISAEDALRHEFFAPSHEALRKERLLRKGLNVDSGTTHVWNRQPETCEGLS